MKKVVFLSLSIILISCLKEPKKEMKSEPKIEYGNHSKAEKQNTEEKVNMKEDIVLDNKIPLQTFENDSEIYSHFDGCGCYFSNSKDNFMVGKKNVFFGELLGKDASVIELMIDGNIEKLKYEGSKTMGDSQYVEVYTNLNHSAVIVLKEENIEQEESVFLSGSISVDNKYFSLLFGRCGC